MSEIVLSAKRLRLGFICIFLWWFPFWAFAAPISDALGIDNVARVTTAIVIIQTAIGLFGFMLVGKPVANIIKKSSFKKAPGIIVYAIIHGKLKEQV